MARTTVQGYTPRSENHPNRPDDARKASIFFDEANLLVAYVTVADSGDVTAYHNDGSLELLRADRVERVLFWDATALRRSNDSEVAA